jgi:hypothetical protein
MTANGNSHGEVALTAAGHAGSPPAGRPTPTASYVITYNLRRSALPNNPEGDRQIKLPGQTAKVGEMGHV